MSKFNYQQLPVRVQITGFADLLGGSALVCAMSVDGIFNSSERMQKWLNEFVKHNSLTDEHYSELMVNVTEGNFCVLDE